MKKNNTVLGIYIDKDDFAFSVLSNNKIINIKTVYISDIPTQEERIHKLSLEIRRILNDNDIDVIKISKPDKDEEYEYIGIIKHAAFQKRKTVNIVDRKSFLDIYFQGMTRKQYADLNKLTLYCLDKRGNYSNKEMRRIVDVEMVNELFNKKFSRLNYAIARSIISALSL